ncbi:MAG: arsenite methyltransferase [Phycisphaerales bacterium]|nr:arsenite methyltransferase [Phycisphaerales bacterium]
MSTDRTPEAVRDTVRQGYAAIATTGVWSGVQTKPNAAGGWCGGGGCCGAGGNATMTAQDVADAIGYAHTDLATVPEGANMGLSCGNPTALASLRPGETVLDLGSGGGLDCFIAGPKVGAGGRVIGVDMTPEMLSKARAGLVHYRAHSGLDNVEFRLGEIEHLPVADNSVDAVISNCVLNLSPDKEQVWREIARVLKPGGRVALSDLALLRPLPAEVRASVEALVGCVAGATLTGIMENTARSAGLTGVRIERKAAYTDAMTDAQDPLYKDIISKLPPGAKIGDYITSVDVSAVKPAAAPRRCC